MKLSLPTRFRLVSAVFVISAILFSSFFAGKTYAVAAFPKNGEIPCDTQKDPEYSSDRPYQASPCEEAPITYFCGNTVKIDLGSVSTPYDPVTCGTGANASCPVDIHRDQSIIVDLTNVQLPILGNTQLTVNSQSPDDQIDDPTKVNNFVAWYLNGTNDKAEYPAVDATTRAGISQVIDTSGPLKKLLPAAILDAQRYDTIITASKTQKPYIKSTYELQESGDPQNHNQIVVCTTHNIFGINNPWIGAEKPIPCYEGVNNPAQGKPYRLKDWGEGNLSVFNTFFNFLGAQKWDNKYPPLPWQFTSNLYYQKAYREWKGATCVIVPIFNTLACASIPILSPNRTWSDLYPYIPLANTVDKKGMQKIKSVDINAPQATIDPDTKVIDILHNPQLYLAHSLENYSLTNTLKTTYVPSTVTLTNTEGYPGATTPSTVEDNSSQCRIIDSRTNPGDYATFSKPKSFINVHVIYDITEIECSTPKYTCLTDPITLAQYNCGWHATCRSSVTAVIPSDSLTPYADEIWGNTVAGSDSIFQRIYPKVGADAPVTCIADIPAVSPATYKLRDTSIAQGLSLTEVVEPDGLTSFTGDGITIAAQLYFPHYGGVLDYFLKGIQTALRPQGYGPPTPSSGQYCSSIVCGELPTLPKGAGACSLGGISSRVGSIPQSLKDIVEAAAQTFKTPPNLILAEMFGEGVFNPGRFSWTDQNVKNWATCVKIPGCSETGEDHFMGFNGNTFQNIANTPAYQSAMKLIDPTRTKYSQCNLLDTIFAAAYNLHDSADGSPFFQNASGVAYSCLGHTLNTGTNAPSSCSWDDSQYESAIRIYEFGTGWGNTPLGFYTCATQSNSCLLGGGAAAQCSSDTVDSYDTCPTSGNNSHNLCVWEVAHGN